MNILLPILPALPLAGFVFTALFGRALGKRAHLVPVAAAFVAWGIAVAIAAGLFGGAFGHDPLTFTLWQWLPITSELHAQVGLLADSLTAVLLLVVTTIGLLVHVYSVGYMHDDRGYWRFFAWLNFFLFSMLILVLADNLLLLFAGWELVGVSSWALIGFWYHKPSAGRANLKAFVTNRIGDIGLSAGAMALAVTLGTFNLREILERINELDPTAATLIALLVFAGAAAKSAQFPLHVWLPDAMEGPTPVSALIHAATMVNAGIYLVARMSPLFAHSELAMLIIASIGTFTALFAATIALVQTDIKKVLAYSTISQLGFMFLALGVGAWPVAIFHLVTHGFFKGLLFLGSGSVIHAMGGEQDMRKMGGLWRKIPITYWTMLIGTVAIAGLPPLAGFWSKDEILSSAFKGGHYVLFGVGLFVAALTALYMFRMIALTFWGTSRSEPEVAAHVHESPRVMTTPLILLAIPAAVIGLVIGIPPEGGLIHTWLEPVFEEANTILGVHHEAFSFVGLDGILMATSVAAAVIGVIIALNVYGVDLPMLGLRRDSDPERAAQLAARNPLYKGAVNRWGVDSGVQAVAGTTSWIGEVSRWALDALIDGTVNFAARITGWAGELLMDFDQKVVDALVNGLGNAWHVIGKSSWWVDRHLVDGAVNQVGHALSISGTGMGQSQTGRVQNYALGLAGGLIGMALLYLFTVVLR